MFLRFNISFIFIQSHGSRASVWNSSILVYFITLKERVYAYTAKRWRTTFTTYYLVYAKFRIRKDSR